MSYIKRKCAGEHLKELLETRENEKIIKDNEKVMQELISNEHKRIGREINLIKSEICDIKCEMFINNYKPLRQVDNKKYDLHSTCLRCGEKQYGCMHHIVPRHFGGNDLSANLVFLCNKCHDKIEIYTFELFNKKMIYDINVLRSYIIDGFPGEP